MTQLPLTTHIAQSSTRTRKNRVLSAQFGDGYSQEAPDGTNSIVDEWTIVYENLSSTNRDAVWSVLNAVGGWDILTWQAPGDSITKKWKVTKDGVNESPHSGDTFSMTFKIKQVF